MVGPGIIVRPNMRGMTIGNSICHGGACEAFGVYLAQKVAAAYAAPRGGVRTVPGVLADNALLPAGADAGAPTWFSAGIAGVGVAGSGPLTTAAAKCNPDFVIVELETNDAFNLYSDALYSTGVSGIIATLLASCPNLVASQILWLQAYCIGEKHPFGSNPTDTVANGLMGKDAILRTLATSLGFTVAESRLDAAGNGVWLTDEVANNPSNLSAGIRMEPDTLHPLTNPTRSGIAFWVDNVVWPAMTIAGVG